MNLIKRYAWSVAFGIVIGCAGWTESLSWELWAAVLPVVLLEGWSRGGGGGRCLVCSVCGCNPCTCLSNVT